MKLQKLFDEKHKGAFSWHQKINSENIHILEYLIIGLIGEVGELANIIKKIRRGDLTYSEHKDDIAEEIVDVFIYLLKMAYQNDIDIEQEFLRKLEKNKRRFKMFEL
ncbi:MAG: MazG nucleotide pyrophosphohydrolase domain-containing protein [Patescibacteria group bacterium]|nr:MazG nucleotide pyrophosphohydrolase domain-containing protein [Patescibacteria group bacterium]